MKKYHEDHKEELAAKQKETRANNRAFYSEKERAYRLRLKKLALEFFGPCACCGESRLEFISIDHINGGGTKKRMMGEKSGSSLLKSFNKMGWPEDLKKEYRILCHNCNQAIGFMGYCPHQRERDASSRDITKTT